VTKAAAFLLALTLQAETRLHHVHLRAPDAAAAIDFFAERLGGKRTQLLGHEALSTPHGAIVISNSTAAAENKTALAHLGWGVRDIRQAYIQHLDRGTPFAQPLEYLRADFFFAYVKTPTGVDVEIYPAAQEGFGHVHLHSRHPVVAGEWYARYLGLRPTRPLTTAPLEVGRYKLSSSASLSADGLSLVIFPTPDAAADFAPSENSPVDHLAFAVDNLDQRLLDLKRSGARILEMPREIAPGLRAAMVMGPDRLRIALVEER
jgi:catechol 2,3-dioxygenase-like lactoylglutathione lyase family enzyme